MKNSWRVYSTESGRIRQPAPAQSGPPLCAAPQATDDGVVRIFRERGGRNGKVVTVIRGLPARDLEARATEPPWDPTEKGLYVDYPHLWVDLTRYGWIFANLEEPLVRYRVSRDLFRRRSSWNKALTELRARRRAMNELCMASPSNVAWTGAYLGLRLLPAVLARWVYRYLRPRTTRV